MTTYRKRLPQLGTRPFLTDGGIETTLIYHDGLDLPHFAAFDLLRTEEGTESLRSYFTSYAKLARRYRVGLILESPTWRASRAWGERLGYTPAALAAANLDAIRLLEEIRLEYDSAESPVVVSGCIGPRGDGYVPDQAMTEYDAERYHGEQIAILASTSADMVCALTLNRAEEAIGMSRAAKRAGIPIAISFTVETDGRLPTGQSLADAITQVDEATASTPAYFMINCAHPTHFASALRDTDARWVSRIRGIRANASTMSHAELNDATELDAGDPEALGAQYRTLRAGMRSLCILGGCCGTDTRHIEQVAAACLPLFDQVN